MLRAGGGGGEGGGHGTPRGENAAPASMEHTAHPLSHPPVSSFILVTPEPTRHFGRNNKYLWDERRERGDKTGR